MEMGSEQERLSHSAAWGVGTLPPENVSIHVCCSNLYILIHFDYF